MLGTANACRPARRNDLGATRKPQILKFLPKAEHPALSSLKYTQPTPQASLMLEYATGMSHWSKVLGLGPAYRVGLSADPSAAEDADPLLDALGG